MEPTWRRPLALWVARICGLLFIMFLGWYQVAGVRTIHAGAGLLTDMFFNVLAWVILGFGIHPLLTAVCLMGLPWRKFTVLFVLSASLTIIAVEAFARAQEMLVMRRYGKDPGKELFVPRWPPFRHHDIKFIPGYGWSGNC